MLLSLVCFVKEIHQQREVIEIFAESAQCKGTIFAILKQGVVHNLAVIFFQVCFLLYSREVKMLKCAMIGAFTVTSLGNTKK